jgi:hypothetical protein
MLQYAGDHRGADQRIWRGKPAGGSWSACWLSDGRLTALLTVGVPRDLQQGRRLIESRVRVDPAKIADPAVPLREAVLR